MNEVQTIDPSTRSMVAASPDAGSIMRIIEMSMTRADFDITKIEALLAVKERWDAAEARKAYVAAMAEFKKDPPSITKEKRVFYKKKDGSVVDYMHATLGNVVNAITAGLGEFGFSHRWTTKQENGRITVACVITHQLGHSEQTTLEASPDDSGGKNNIQAVASAVSYLERYTLLSAVGLATQDMDDDGRAAGKPAGDVSTLQAWNERAMDAKTLDELRKVKDDGRKAFSFARDPVGQKAFLDTIQSCLDNLRGAA